MQAHSHFIIWFHARSGSSHLASLLQSHPKIVCYQELFFGGERAGHDDYYARSGMAAAEFLRGVFGGSHQPYPVAEAQQIAFASTIGFKFKYQQATTYPEIFAELKLQGGLKIIHLRRHNLLSILASTELLPVLFDRFGDANVGRGQSLDTLDRTVALDPTRVKSQLDEIRSEHLRYEHSFAGFATLEVSYEELVLRPANTYQKICRFLEVTANARLTSCYQKFLPLPPSEAISNFDEIRDALTGTEYEQFLVAPCVR